MQPRRSRGLPKPRGILTTLLAVFALLAGFLAVAPATANAAPGDLAFGKVVVDSNKNNAIDAGPTGSNDTPLGGVTVTLKGSNPDHEGWTTVTKADGTWAFSATEDRSESPGPFTVTIDAKGVNGDAYITPVAPTAGVNDFTRVAGDGNTQKSVSPSIPAGTTNLELNALVYPTWSTNVIALADPDGYDGKAIYTGTPTFDADDSKPGLDSGEGNDRVRTGDVVNYNWSVTASSEQDTGSNFDGWFEQTLKLEPGAVATFGQIPSSCDASATTITALPSGTKLLPRVDPPAGTTSVVLACKLGTMGTDVTQKTLDTQVYVSANSSNGATFTTSVRTYGATDQGVTTARPDGPHDFGPFEITAAPRYDLEKSGARTWGGAPSTRDIPGLGKVQGYDVEYNIQITTDRRTGVESFKQPISFEESFWGGYNAEGQNGPNGQINPALKWYMVECVPFADSNWNFGGTVFGSPKAATNGNISTKENSAANSGSCAVQRNGDPNTGNYTLTVKDIDTSAATYPTKDTQGKPLPANKFVVASYGIKIFIPLDEIDAMTGGANDMTGSVKFWNRVGNFDPVGNTGAPNYGGDGEPGYCQAGPNTDASTNCEDMPAGGRSNNVAGPQELSITPGNIGKAMMHMRGSWGWRGDPLPSSGGAGQGDGQVQPGQTYTSQVGGDFPFGSDSMQMCDVWDGTVMKLDELRNDKPGTVGPYDPPAGLYSGVVSETLGNTADNRDKIMGYQKNYVIKYAHVDLSGDTANNGTFSNADNRFGGVWTAQHAAANGAGIVCGNPNVTWYDNPQDVPGGIDAVNASWLQLAPGFSQPANTSVRWMMGLQQRNTYFGGPHDGEIIPERTISANYSNVMRNASAGWVGTKYVPGTGTTDGVSQPGENNDPLGDRWTLVRAQMAVTKHTVAGKVNGVDATGAAAVGTSGSAKAGTPVIWQIDPTLTSISDTPPKVENVVVTDTLPAGAVYDAAGTAALEGNTPPTSVTENANGTTTLVWQLGSLTPNEAIGPFKVATIVDSLLPNNTSLVNKVNIKADGLIAVKNAHNDDHTVVVTQPGSLQLKKSVDHVLDLQDKDQVYTLQVKNFGETLRVQPPTIIDVFPHNGDATNDALVNRNPASKYSGTNTLTAPPTVTQFDGKTPATGTFYYTTIDPTKVPQNLNADTDPSIWSTTFTANATAFKFVADKPLGNVNEGASSGLSIKYTAKQDGNAAGDLYANRFTAFSDTFKDSGKYQLLTSNQVLVRVVGFSLGDLVWFDVNNDGKYTAGIDTVAPQGVKVQVFKADGTLAPGGEVTTNKDGRWVVNDLPEGDYYAVIPASEFAAGGKLEGATAQTKGYQADPNTDKNEGEDHNGAQQGDGSIRTGNIHLSATVNGSTITGNEPLNDNTGNMKVTPGTTDGFTNFTLDMALYKAPGYEFTKTSDPASGSTVQAGDVVTYTLTGENTGGTPIKSDIKDDLTNVLAYADIKDEPVATIEGVDTVPEAKRDGNDLSWAGDLKPGQKVTVVYSVTVKKGMEGKILNNHASSTGTPPYDPPITPPDVTTEHPIPGYEFTKAADPTSGTTVYPGDEITYTLTGKNTGATVLDPVNVNDDLSKVLDNATISAQPTVTIEGQDNVPGATVANNKLSWTGKLEKGQSVVITYKVKINDNAGEKAVLINNHASSNATPPGEPPLTPPDVTTEHPVPGYEFDKTSDPTSGSTVQEDREITYTLSGKNTGATDIESVIKDDLTKVLKFAKMTTAPKATITGPGAAAAPDVKLDGNALSWTGDLKKGQSVAITYTVTVEKGHEGELINNHASSTGTPPGEPPITPPDVTTEHPIPGYSFDKKANPVSGTTVYPGSEIVYTLTGVNTGATVLDPVVINDDLSKVLDNAAFSVEPKAVFTGVDAGDAPAPTVTDNKLVWTGSLKKGQSVEVTYTVKLNGDADTKAVLINNHASSSATPPGEPPITPPEVETEHPVPGYEFTKVSDPESGTLVMPGKPITYTVTGKNTGATDLDPVVINDDLSKVLNHGTLTGQPVVAIEGQADAPKATVEGTTLSWTGSLKKGQSVTITYTVTLNKDAEGVLVNNHASSSATPPGEPPITPPDVETEHPTPGYTFSKVADPVSGSAVKGGQVITYTLSGNNFGKTVLDPVEVKDDLSKVLEFADIESEPVAKIVKDGVESDPATGATREGNALNWTGTLQPGEQIVVKYSVKVKEGMEGKTLNNHASSTATPPGEPPITPPDVVTEHPVPGYTFDKTADPASGSTVQPGGTITYTLKGVNTGATKLSPVRISDDLSKVLNNAKMEKAPAVTIEGQDDVPAVKLDGDQLSWVGSLEIGQSVSITYTVKVNEGTDKGAVVINNHASSEATPPGLPPITPPDVTTEHPVPGYEFTKDSDPKTGTTVVAGTVVTYTLEGVNTGATPLDPVTIDDDLAEVFAYADAEGTPSVKIVKGDVESDPAQGVVVDGNKLSWSGTLQVGEKVVVTYSVKVKEGMEGKILKNKATSEATPPGEPPITPPPGETEHPIPGYTVEKTSDPKSGSVVNPGQEITYTVTGTNTGATKLDPVNINDDLAQVLNNASLVGDPSAKIEGEGAGKAPAPSVDGTTLKWSGVLEVGQKVVLTYKVKVNDDANEKAVLITNKVTSDATPPGVPPITPPEVVTEHPVPGYTFTKDSDPKSGTTVRAGQEITYTLSGTNTGATKLDPVVVNDDLSKVLNASSLVGEPSAKIYTEGQSDPVDAAKPVLEGDKLTWQGSLNGLVSEKKNDQGEVVREATAPQKVVITYTVKINDDVEGKVKLVNNSASSEATPVVPEEPPYPPITPPKVETEHPIPGYEFSKSSDPVSGTVVAPGKTIQYTLTGVNTGGTELKPVEIKDDLSKVLNHAKLTSKPKVVIEGGEAGEVPAATLDGTALSWKGTLAKDQSVVITYTVTLDKDAEGVLVNNHASSSATPPVGPPITPPDVETEHPTPGYTFSKLADPVSGSAVKSGDVITYTLSGNNFGKTVLDPVVINDDLTEVLKFADIESEPVVKIVSESGEADPAEGAVLEGNKLSWTGSLQPGERAVVTYSVKVKADVEGKLIKNKAKSEATPPGEPPITPPEVVTEHPIPGFELTKAADPGSGEQVKPGTKITYTVTGINTGATVLDPVTITDDMSKVLNNSTMSGKPAATIVGADGAKAKAKAPTLDGTTLWWEGKLAKGERVIITYSVTVNKDAWGVKLRNVVTSNHGTPPPPVDHEVPPNPSTPPTEPPVNPTEPPVNPTEPGNPTTPPTLPNTGTTITVGLLVVAGMALLGGLALMMVRRRGRHEG